jgi:hypothetical protein
MNDHNPGLISIVEFEKRLAQLCLSSGTAELPRRQRDRHILLKSLSMDVSPDRSYTELEINGIIHEWLTEVGQSLGLDHVTLRRTLIDEGYLVRSSAGDSYRQGRSTDGNVHFEADIEAVNSRLVVRHAIEEISRRRARHATK